MSKGWLVSSLVVVLGASSAPAIAQDAFLHHAQSGALIAYADAEALVLFGALSAKEFDPELVKSLSKEIERSLKDATRAVDRAKVLGSDDKAEPELNKLLEALKRASDQLEALSAKVQGETDEKDEPIDHREESDGAKEKAHDWSSLKNIASWLAQDIKDARTAHGVAGKKLKGGPLKPPPKPTGKRPAK